MLQLHRLRAPKTCRHRQFGLFIVFMIIALASFETAIAKGDVDKGAGIYRTCASCHSLVRGDHRTGPSLSGLWGRKAGTVEGFTRYSPAIKNAGVTWDDRSMDAWLENPGHFIPGNRMTFPGIKDKAARADLVAYLRIATNYEAASKVPTGKRTGDGRTMGQSNLPNLKTLGPEHQVSAIRYCKDTYFVFTADGQEHVFWEFNLRLKTDSSERGPDKGRSAIVPSGMRGDRASLIFASPSEIGSQIKHTCDN